VHGWPSLDHYVGPHADTVQDKYHLIVPDLRGFGASTHPGDEQTSGAFHDLVDDLACIMWNAGVDKATCVGHDWGSQVCWEAARARPDLIEAAAGTIPYIPAIGEYMPIENTAKLVKSLSYQVYFQEKTEQAIAELNGGVRKTLRATLGGLNAKRHPDFLKITDGFITVYGDEELPPTPLLSELEEDYFVEQYEIQGFKHTLQFYTYGNRKGYHDFARAQKKPTIEQPCALIYPDSDPVGNWMEFMELLNSRAFQPKLTVSTPIHASHWPQLERPVEYNAELHKWLDKLPPTASTRAAVQHHTEL